jgi:hypothetical protein
MAKAESILIDEIHLNLRIPNDLSDNEAEAVRVALAGDDLLARLRLAVRAALCEFPALVVVRVLLSR